MKTGAIIIEGHVQGLSNTRALGSKGIPVYVVDINTCIAKYSRYCKKFFICPLFKSDEFADFLIDLAKRENLKDWILIPSNDHAVKTISRNRNRLTEYYKVITQDESVINNIYDKSRLFNIANECGVPLPVTIYHDTTEEAMVDIKFPVLTKGKEGLNFYKAMGKKAFISENASQLALNLLEISKKINIQNIFTQEVIPFDGSNKTISFTAFCDSGEIKTYWIGEKIREHPIRFGTATYCKSIICDELLQLSIPLLAKLKYTGACEVEFLFDPRDKKYKLIEINARTWLWVGLARACGIDYANIIYEFLNNNLIEYPKQYTNDIKWINYLTDTYVTIQLLLSKNISLRNYFKSLKGEKVQAAFTFKDPIPGIMLLLLSIYLAKKRII